MKYKIFSLTIILLVNFLITSSTFCEDIKFAKSKDFVTLSFNKPPEVYKIDFYNYGLNIIAKGLKINNLRIYKFQDDTIVRTIPLDKEKSLIKVQYPIKNLKNHIKIIDKGKFVIRIYRNEIVSKPVNSSAKAPVDKQSIVDEAKKLSLIPTAPTPSTLSSPATNYNINRKPVPEIVSQKRKTFKAKETPSNDFLNVKDEDKKFSKNIVKTYSILFILCLFILGGAFLLKKFYRKVSPAIGQGMVKVLYKKDIAMKKSIAITKILNDYYILGITQHSISYIDKIVSDSVLEELKLIEGEKEKDKFIKYLKKEEKKEEEIDKDKMIKMIQVKLKEYKNNFKAS